MSDPRVDGNAVVEVIARIAALTDQLNDLYVRRRAMMVAMAKTGMTRREIGVVWGVSNVAVTKTINGDKFKYQPPG